MHWSFSGYVMLLKFQKNQKLLSWFLKARMLVSGEMKAEKHVDSRFSNFWYAEKLKFYYKRQWQKVDG